MAILNLRHQAPPESSGSDAGEPDAAASVRRMLQSGEPPGLDRIWRFVRKPRPRLWRVGVGIWLWIARIAHWLMRLLRWIGRLAPRLARALRLAGFFGRRAQNFGARVGAVGRNWSSAHGRLGGWGSRLTRFGGRLVEGGASVAQVGDGAAELTKAAARFLADGPDAGVVVGDPPGAPPPERPRRAPIRRGERPTAASGPGPRKPRERRAAPPVRPADASAAEAAPRRTVLPEPSPALDGGPAPAEADPPPLPDDLPFRIQNRIRGLGQRPGRDRVERLILEIIEVRGWTGPTELARWLGFGAAYLSRRYLTPMTKAGRLVRRYPNRPTHPDQAYQLARGAVAPEAKPQG